MYRGPVPTSQHVADSDSDENEFQQNKGRKHYDSSGDEEEEVKILDTFPIEGKRAFKSNMVEGE